MNKRKLSNEEIRARRASRRKYLRDLLCANGCTCTPYRAPELRCAEYVASAPAPAPTPAPAAPLPVPAPVSLSVGEQLAALAPIALEAFRDPSPRALRFVALIMGELADYVEEGQKLRAERHADDILRAHGL